MLNVKDGDGWGGYVSSASQGMWAKMLAARERSRRLTENLALDHKYATRRASLLPLGFA